MATLRELKGRIGSVASTEKITGAMKMISSAKMRKAELELRRLVPFRSGIRGIIANLLASDAEFTSPLTEVREVRRLAIVAFGSDDGLCGAYNANLCKFVQACVDELRASAGEALQVEIYPVGAKMLKAVSRVSEAMRLTVVDPAGATAKTGGDDVKTLLEALMQRYLAGEIDRVDLAYMHYHSAGRQRPVAEQLLPVDPATLVADGTVASNRPYIYEPDPLSIFRTLLPMHLLASLQDAFAENRASEQAARVMAMQAASDNARKLLEQLQLEYNKLRQQSITTELLDIVGGQTRD
ncbi:MAG: ATP synthase F1 subunit gamma [Muribaculaceae bacterium]|nr:ATP synthase F1 subunit gamma [Muribaculaceae bacterium]